ncbi:hypothetical protein GOP47_0003620 [Adiantum capillus-veneris]|uniref:Uncharacterized protein n=1 Tax=Adiantum capillus-veneris TaxID=13818 RepID=A0A9D4ZNQ5_ADICA|nr:hypothetical protein GOP47_0003620 [Adiantum capillus-veneris]
MGLQWRQRGLWAEVKTRVQEPLPTGSFYSFRPPLRARKARWGGLTDSTWACSGGRVDCGLRPMQRTALGGGTLLQNPLRLPWLFMF